MSVAHQRMLCRRPAAGAQWRCCAASARSNSKLHQLAPAPTHLITTVCAIALAPGDRSTMM